MGNNSFFEFKIVFILSTEIWSLDENDNIVNLKIAEPKLSAYEIPELFIVVSDFCSKNWGFYPQINVLG